MYDLNALTIFGTVVEAGSFSEAARRLGVPVSSVSRRVADLERDLGVRLLERSTRSLRLTSIGSNIFTHAAATMDIARAVVDATNAHRSAVTGTLRLSAPPSISDSFVAPVVAALQRDHPDLCVHATVSERFYDLIAEGVDAALIVGDVQRNDLVATPLLRYRHRILASPAYIRAFGAPEHPDDLATHRMLSFSRWTPETSWTLVHDADASNRTVTFRAYFSINDYAGLATRLLDGSGIGELPPLIASDAVESGRLVEVLPGWRFDPNELKVVYPAGRYRGRVVDAFIAAATSIAAERFPGLALP